MSTLCAHAQKIDVHFSTGSREYKQYHPIWIEFAARNNSQDTIVVLNWHNIKYAHIFLYRINQNGTPLPIECKHFSLLNSAVIIPPNRTELDVAPVLTCNNSISEAYGIGDLKPGKYKIAIEVHYTTMQSRSVDTIRKEAYFRILETRVSAEEIELLTKHSDILIASPEAGPALQETLEYYEQNKSTVTHSFIAMDVERLTRSVYPYPQNAIDFMIDYVQRYPNDPVSADMLLVINIHMRRNGTYEKVIKPDGQTSSRFNEDLMKQHPGTLVSRFIGRKLPEKK